MNFLDLFLLPIAAALDWWTMLWSRDDFFLSVLLGVIYIRLLFHFIINPLLKADKGSDRADKHPRRTKKE